MEKHDQFLKQLGALLQSGNGRAVADFFIELQNYHNKYTVVSNFHEAIEACLKADNLTQRDRDFLTNLRGFIKISEKQTKWLNDICHRCNVRW